MDPIDASPLKESKKEHSPKPTELLKDLQSTVSQAKTKIGDLQVEAKVLDVPRKQISSVCCLHDSICFRFIYVGDVHAHRLIL